MLGVRVPPGLPLCFYRVYLMEKIKLMLSKVKRFLREAKVELKKVTWPTPKEALASTSVVIVVVIIVSIFLGVVDLGLTKIIRLVLG